MEIKRLRGLGVANAKQKLRVNHEDIQNFVLHIVGVAIEKYGAKISGVEFLCSEREASSAFINARTCVLSVNFNQMRTLRDLVYCIGHEAGHSIQVAANGVDDMLRQYHLYNLVYGYKDNPMEVEADVFGFRFESEANYKSMVINSDTESIFIQRKQVRG